MLRIIPASLLACLLLGPLACEPDELSPLALAAQLEINRAAIDFGNTSVGRQRHAGLRLENRGQVALRLRLTIDGAPATVFSVPQELLYLEVGQIERFQVGFVPDRPQRLSATLNIEDLDDPAVAVRVPLSGTGLLPTCDDRNPCTEDRFDLDLATCVFAPLSGSCDDGRGCTEDDRCIDGACIGQLIPCDDGVACTIDACDEEHGCLALPDHSACDAGADLCTIGVCDAELGCLVDSAADGTLCGEPSCVELRVCVAGQCRSGPAPDGLACDDGDPCTEGDRCQAGSCQPGPGQGLAVSTPVELEVASPLSSYWLTNPVGVLAVNLPSDGGFEVVFADFPYWQDISVSVVRARFDADGSLLWAVPLAQSEQARAAYVGDDLVLLLLGCRDCYGDDSLVDEADECLHCDTPCPLQLQRWNADMSGPLTACLGNYREVTDIAVAASEQGVDVAWVEQEIVNSTRPPGALVSHHFSPELQLRWSVPVESWTERPRASWRDLPRSLQLDHYGGEPVLAYERAATIGYEGACGYCAFYADDCTCDDAEDFCSAPVPFAALAAERFNPIPMDAIHYGVVSLAMASRGLSTVPGPQPAVATLNEIYGGGPGDFNADLCTRVEQVTLIEHGEMSGSPQTTVLAEYPAGQVLGITGTRLLDRAAVLVQSWQGVIELLTASADDGPTALQVPGPIPLYPNEQRAFGPRISATIPYTPGRFLPLAVGPAGRGLVAVAITTHDFYGAYPPEPDPCVGAEPDEPGCGSGELPEPPGDDDGSGADSPPDNGGCSYEECGPNQDAPAPVDRLAVFTVGCGVTIPAVNGQSAP